MNDFNPTKKTKTWLLLVAIFSDYIDDVSVSSEKVADLPPPW